MRRSAGAESVWHSAKIFLKINKLFTANAIRELKLFFEPNLLALAFKFSSLFWNSQLLLLKTKPFVLSFWCSACALRSPELISDIKMNGNSCPFEVEKNVSHSTAENVFTVRRNAVTVNYCWSVNLLFYLAHALYEIGYRITRLLNISNARLGFTIEFIASYFVMDKRSHWIFRFSLDCASPKIQFIHRNWIRKRKQKMVKISNNMCEWYWFHGDFTTYWAPQRNGERALGLCVRFGRMLNRHWNSFNWKYELQRWMLMETLSNEDESHASTHHNPNQRTGERSNRVWLEVHIVRHWEIAVKIHKRLNSHFQLQFFVKKNNNRLSFNT